MDKELLVDLGKEILINSFCTFLLFSLFVLPIIFLVDVMQQLVIGILLFFMLYVLVYNARCIWHGGF